MWFFKSGASTGRQQILPSQSLLQSSQSHPESLYLLLLLLNRDKPQLKDTTTIHNKDSASTRLQAAVQTENITKKNADEKTELGIG